MVINSPCLTNKKDLAIPGQTATGKEFSNPLMAGSLPKTISAKLKDLPEPFNYTYGTPSHTKKVFSNMARQSKGFLGKVTPLFDSMLVQNQAPKGKGSAILPEPYPTPSTSQPNVSEPQIELLQIETPLTISHESQTKAHIEQILPSPSIYQRKYRKTQKHRRVKKVTELPQTSVPLDLRADKPNEPPLPEGHIFGSGEGRMAYTFELMDIVPPTPYDSPLLGGYTPGSDEGRLKLEELMAIDFDRLDDDMENVEGETVYAATSEVSTAGALVSTARPTVGTAGPSPTATGTSVGILEDEMVTMADTLIAIRQTRTRPSYLPRPTLVVITDTEQEQRRLTTPPPSQPLDSRDKGKEYDTIQASIDADALFTARLQQEEIESSSPLKKEHNFWINDFVPMDSEKEEKKSVKPESVGKKGKRIKRVVDSALKQKSSKKQKMMQEQESAKCDEDVAVYYEHEKEELRMWLTVVPDEEETVDLEILSAKYPIVDWKS
ncbi:hypothetical protein Tco_1044110 [Tanacetum coccineum]|uniref:Uncharacterized protein n=1 Tax=Tanacetum coccineum TaxID=301880 RepID=A0ABQ5GQ61_9ASTR